LIPHEKAISLVSDTQ